ncbi:peptidoglycan-binding domain-containing protein [Falsiroseomonas selenitidurans]|uniref:Peptidoglycan-binding protein n=1 Tax=Falsiroseomonas selenitidurans TaxID=2716335 RepID=A0ABX1E0M1_9PROT|nr:peptidoglycan-binding domain-containing protein [Falsiroseomonas selenitidurans]NKC30707.1 peptidoglycan-binding protein [Falsiroseomonas selenitidurans]
MNVKTRLMGAAALSLMIAACGTDPQERVSGGAAAGAATGAGVGALGGPVGALAGAAIGGGAGAVTGAVTEPRDVNLGRPVWDNPNARVPGVNERSADRGSYRSGRSERVSEAQRALNQQGFNAGPVDGIWGPRSRSAMREYQRANNMAATGQLDRSSMASLTGSGNQGGRQSMDSMRSTGANQGSMGGTSGGGMGANDGMPGNRPTSEGAGTDRANQPGAGSNNDSPGGGAAASPSSSTN